MHAFDHLGAVTTYQVGGKQQRVKTGGILKNTCITIMKSCFNTVATEVLFS